MTVENLVHTTKALPPEQQEAVMAFVEFLQGNTYPSPFLDAVHDFIERHPELLRRLAQ